MLSKMPKSSVAKTALALSLFVFVVAVSLLLLLPKTHETLTLGGVKLNIARATTIAQQAKGLSGRPQVKADEGLLFVFSNSSKEHCVWMKDMQFAIDVLWLNQHKAVVDTLENLQPNTYPRAFCPKQDAKYMLETIAGAVQNNRWKIGQQAAF